VEPADRQQMGKPGPAERVRILRADRALVAGRERDADARRRGAERRPDMGRQPLAQARPARGGGGPRDRAQRPAGGADLQEPCGPGEIIGAGQGRPRRRHQPRAQPDPVARRQPVRGGRLVDVDAHARRQIGRGDRPQLGADQAARGEQLHPRDLRLEGDDGRPRQNGRRDSLRPYPGERRAGRDRQPADQQEQRCAPPRGAQRHARAGDRQRQPDQRQPGRPVGQQEPAGNAHGERDRQPERKLFPLRLQPGLDGR